jgi:Family of unknown function (DUF6481)
MKFNGYKNDDFNNRLSSAAEAKAALLERFRSRPGPDDPAVIARKAEQAAIEEAREKRLAERKAIRDAEEARLAAEMAAVEKLRQEELARRKAEESAKSSAMSAERAAAAKAARDARYAARRARKR